MDSVMTHGELDHEMVQASRAPRGPDHITSFVDVVMMVEPDPVLAIQMAASTWMATMPPVAQSATLCMVS